MSGHRALVIGGGRMGRRHVEVLRALDVELAGVADVMASSLQAVEEECGVPRDRLFADPAEALRSARADLVVIATTAQSHAELTCAAADAGARFILCEKPMATSLADCDRMLSACAKTGARLAINHQMRYMAQYVEPKRLLASPEFGGVTSISVVAGNFGMAMNGTHYLEMFRYVTEDTPATVSGWFSADEVPNPRGPQFRDRAGVLRLEGHAGKRFHMDIGSDQGHGMLVVYGARHGRIVVDELAGWMHTVHRKAEHRELPTTRYGMPSVEERVTIAPADVIEPTRRVVQDLIEGGDHPDGACGRLAVAALVAAYHSDENGHIPVRLDGALPAERRFPWA